MSRLSEILGVKEGQEFRFRDEKAIYRINENRRQFACEDWWSNIYDEVTLCEMIAHPELIHPIPKKPQITEQQITAIKGRIAEGTPWAAKDDEGNMTKFFIHKPIFSEKYQTWIDEEAFKIDYCGFEASSHISIYDFVTDINSPVYLPELVEEEEK